MTKTIYLITILLFITSRLIFAQQSATPSSAVNIEVLTDTLHNEGQAQQLRLSIQTNGLDNIEIYKLFLERTEVKLSLLEAKLNGEDLWILNARTKANRENVLSWYYEQQSSTIYIFPPDAPLPYALEVNLRADLKESEFADEYITETVKLEIQTENGDFEAIPAGRGNRIILTEK